MLKDSYVEQAVKAAPGMDYFFKVSIAAALVVAGLPLFFRILYWFHYDDYWSMPFYKFYRGFQYGI